MIGEIISHYRILEKLGEGGMGVVYKAQDLKLDRLVALKFFPLHQPSSAMDIGRFKQEAKAISSLNHPNIATIHDIDETGEQRFLVLEYLSGGTLKARIRQFQSSGMILPLGEIVERGLETARGLAHAHRHGMIHRDVKTDNIMITEDGTTKITDFGLARFSGSSYQTRSDSVAGTVAYMSPEQVRGEGLDHRTDLFSLGIVLYELATGHLPFRGEHDTALSYSIVNEDPLPLTSFNPDVPPSLAIVIGRCLEKDRSKRYQNAAEIIEDLESVKSDISNGESVPNRGGLRRYWRRWIAVSLVVLIAIALAVLVPWKGSSVKPHSIAVLPFKNLSAEKENEYFSDGITEDVIARLSKIATIQVISRTSVMHYKNSEMRLKDIGSELRVATVLEGSVRREGNKVRIVAQLIDANTDDHLWAETYDQDMTGIFGIQSDVAEKIANALEANISPGERHRLEKKATGNLVAYDLYLKGRYHWNKRLPADLDRSIEYFEQASEHDPTYASAYAGLADAYIILGDFDIRPPKETYPKAREAAMKALELDEDLPEAHTSLAYAIMHYEWDWSAAEKEFRRAIELAPNSAQAHSWYALYLSQMGRFESAVSESREALALDPFSAAIRSDAGLTFYFDRQYDTAIHQFQAALEMDPTFVVANIPLGGAYVQKQMYPEAIAAFQKVTVASAFVTSKAHPVPIAALAYVYGVSGRKEDALAMLDLLLEESNDEYVAPYWMSVAYVGIGNSDKALGWLEKAYEVRDGSFAYMNADPVFDKLRSDPRFTQLLKKARLEK